MGIQPHIHHTRKAPAGDHVPFPKKQKTTVIDV
jgi:hypothetical protein